MTDAEVAQRKLASIDRCLERIEDVRGEGGAHMRPVDREDILAVNLQRAAQAAIDLAQHIAASEGFGVSDTLAGAFTRLESHGVISHELAERLRRMAGFRNIAVHDYEQLDPAILEAIATHHLDDLRDFAAAVLDRYGEALGA